MNELKEEFRSIPGYEGYYEVSNFGNVKSLKREFLINGKYPSTVKEKILRQTLNKDGYYRILLYKDGKREQFNIHILVAMVFLGHVPDGHKIVVDHIDNNKLNNRVSNLQLISQRENSSKDKKNGTSKYVGVTWNKDRDKWVSRITINGKFKYLGYFTSEEEAAEAYQNALKIYNDGGDLSFMETRIPTSKYNGVSWENKSSKWKSQIQINGKQKYLGLFTSEEEAHEAYQNALKIYHDGGDLSFMETRIPTSKYNGVSWNKNANKWMSCIKINGKNKYLGYFTSEEEAHEAYQKALKEKMNTN